MKLLIVAALALVVLVPRISLAQQGPIVRASAKLSCAEGAANGAKVTFKKGSATNRQIIADFLGVTSDEAKHFDIAFSNNYRIPVPFIVNRCTGLGVGSLTSGASSHYT